MIVGTQSPMEGGKTEELGRATLSKFANQKNLNNSCKNRTLSRILNGITSTKNKYRVTNDTVGAF